MAFGLKLPLHGRQHKSTGADPIWPGEPILFNVHNGDEDEGNHGGWLWVITDDSEDHGYGELGLLLADKSEEGIKLVAQNAGNTLQTLLTLANNLGATLSAMQGNITVHAQDDEAQVLLVSNSATQLIVQETVGVSATILTGDSFSVYSDELSDEVLRVDSDGRIHIQTGQTIIADL